MHQTLFSASPYSLPLNGRMSGTTEGPGTGRQHCFGLQCWYSIEISVCFPLLLLLPCPSHAVRDTMAFVEHMESKVLVGTTFSPLQ